MFEDVALVIDWHILVLDYCPDGLQVPIEQEGIEAAGWSDGFA